MWFFGTSEAGLDGQIALLSLPLLKSTGDTCDPSTLLNSPALALMAISLLALMVSSGMQRLYVQKAAYNHAGCWPAGSQLCGFGSGGWPLNDSMARLLEHWMC